MKISLRGLAGYFSAVQKANATAQRRQRELLQIERQQYERQQHEPPQQRGDFPFSFDTLATR
ncbi:hypothetical protein HDN1F_35790 [gamma proteobacterium HdN1]|nr:hypothetical protein HDN1F_35790 [gamma proteobacterium HdN1]